MVTADARSDIATALVRLSKTVIIMGCELSDLLNGLVDELKTSDGATAKAGRQFERQKELLPVHEKLRNNDFNDIASLRGRFAVANMSEVALLLACLWIRVR